MSEQELTPWGKEKVYNEKKLRKHEQKLRERLEEAQQEQSDALERLRRAEERMRKRMASVQELEERLNIVHLQMEALQAPHATVVTMIMAGSEASPPMLEAPSVPSETVSPLDETPVENSMDTSPLNSVESVADESDIDLIQVMAGESESQYLERFSDMHTIEVVLVEESVSEEETSMKVDELLEVESVREEALLGQEPSHKNEVVNPVDENMKQAIEARAVAEVAEEAARLAIERAVDLEEYLEQVGSARHLLQELDRLQIEADQATAIARDAEEAARVAERLAGSMQEGEPQESPFKDEEQIESFVAIDRDDADQAVPIEPLSPLEVAQVEEIEEEEDDLETVAAMIIADAAAIAAAQAEAVAEASSARTREARTGALQADQALENVRTAIRKQKLSGEGADVAWQAAEREATHAHALLADAEAAEERALNAAMNAEAEAEVAEGMAFAASSRDERDEKQREENASVQSTSQSVATKLDAGGKDDEEDTVEVPVVRPKNG
jgi:hypothetical protein